MLSLPLVYSDQNRNWNQSFPDDGRESIFQVRMNEIGQRQFHGLFFWRSLHAIYNTPEDLENTTS